MLFPQFLFVSFHKIIELDRIILKLLVIDGQQLMIERAGEIGK
jgi:hypothetical protein